MDDFHARRLASKRELTGINFVCLYRCADAVASAPEEAPMRILAVAILTIGMISAAGLARAQKYDPNFPFCMQVVGLAGSGYQDCSYTTMDQCRASASGRGLTCDPNPYYVGATAAPGRHARQHRRVY